MTKQLFRFCRLVKVSILFNIIFPGVPISLRCFDSLAGNDALHHGRLQPYVPHGYPQDWAPCAILRHHTKVFFFTVKAVAIWYTSGLTIGDYPYQFVGVVHHIILFIRRSTLDKSTIFNLKVTKGMLYSWGTMGLSIKIKLIFIFFWDKPFTRFNTLLTNFLVEFTEFEWSFIA